MSGLVGIVHFDGRPVARDAIQAMADRQPFRTPKGPTVRVDGAAGIAGLPVASGPRPAPLTIDDGVVAAGDVRLDNRDELDSLLRVGPGGGDGEVLLAAYRTWGAACAERLVGDFAFAIWDEDERLLLLARDPMGMRPLYYAEVPAGIAFASEVDQLLQAGIEPRLDEETLAAYLVGTMPSGGGTYYRGVKELPPGTVLIATSDRLRMQNHWQPDVEINTGYSDEWEYAEQLRELLRASVRCRLDVDAPTGTFLSGGLDSGSVASIAAQLIEEGEVTAQIRPYSFAFESFTESDERHISRHIVADYGLAATDVPIEGAWPLDGYPAHGPHRDEPLSGVYQALIERTLGLAADDGVGTMFTSLRGDLMMGGWSLNYLSLLANRRWSRLRDELRRHEKVTGENLGIVVARYLAAPAWRSLRGRGPAAAVRRITSGGRSETNVDPPRWLLVDVAEDDARSTQGASMPTWSKQRRLEWILSDFQMRVIASLERTFARHRLRLADPWSDVRIAEFALSVPEQVLNRPGELSKRLVRTAMIGVMPEEARRQATKIVPTPLYTAALRGPGREVATDLLAAPRLAGLGLVDGAELGAAYQRLLEGSADDDRLWWPLTAEWWLRSQWS